MRRRRARAARPLPCGRRRPGRAAARRSPRRAGGRSRRRLPRATLRPGAARPLRSGGGVGGSPGPILDETDGGRRRARARPCRSACDETAKRTASRRRRSARRAGSRRRIRTGRPGPAGNRARPARALAGARRHAVVRRLPAARLLDLGQALPGRLLPARAARGLDRVPGGRADRSGRRAARSQRDRDRAAGSEGRRHRPGVPRLGSRPRLGDGDHARSPRLRRRALPHDRRPPRPRGDRHLRRRLRRLPARPAPPRRVLGRRVVERLLPPDRPDRQAGPRARLGGSRPVRERARPRSHAVGAAEAEPDLPRVLRRPRRPDVLRREPAAPPRAARRPTSRTCSRCTRAATTRPSGTRTPRCGSSSRFRGCSRPRPPPAPGRQSRPPPPARPADRARLCGAVRPHCPLRPCTPSDPPGTGARGAASLPPC